MEETKREQLKSRTSGSKNKAGCALRFKNVAHLAPGFLFYFIFLVWAKIK